MAPVDEFVARIRAWFGLPELDDPERVAVRRHLDHQARLIDAFREASDDHDAAGERLIDELRRGDDA